MSRCWLTGASSGIGAALALRLLEQGHQVALGGRQASKPAAAGRTLSRPGAVAVGDISEAPQVAQIAADIEQHWGALDLVILNAGTCEYLEPGHFDPALVERVMRTNLLGLCHCIQAALPLLRRGQRRTWW
jgi:NAD(P)-dependent dehydrogenase (short-subunit alcohol dehydrogenase family)